MPKVSVIIATRNRCSFLPRAVASVRAASSNAEIVVVDDASEDQTAEVCNAWVDVQCIHLKRRLGVAAARNVGLVASTSPYVSFLDDDDLRLSGSLDEQVRLLEAQPEAGLIYGKALYGDDRGRAKGGFYPEQCPEGDIFWDLLRSNFIPCPTVVFRRECLTRLGMLDDEASGIEDWDLWVRIAEMYSVIAVDKPVAIWRQGTPASGQFTSHEEELHRKAHRWHRDRWLRLPRAIAVDSLQRRKVSRQFAERASQQLLWAAASRLKAGCVLESTRVGLAGLRMYPLGMIKNILSLSTFRSLKNGVEAYGTPKEARWPSHR